MMSSKEEGLVRLEVGRVRPNLWNCNFLSPQEKQTLTQRLMEDGAEKTPPIIVRQIVDGYEIVDGEHRWQIAKELGWETINAIVNNVDDLTSKALCIGYNRWRGHLNWIKLYQLIKQDQNSGVDVKLVYRDALAEQELKWLLALDSLTFETRHILEEALRKHPEITLEQIHLLSQFPAEEQGVIVEKFKKPIMNQALTLTLNTLKKSQPTQPIQQPPTWNPKQETNPPTSPHPYKPSTHQQVSNSWPYKTSQTTTYTTSQIQNQHQHQEGEEGDGQNVLDVVDGGLEGGSCEKEDVVSALLLVGSLNCSCGQHYLINFKNLSVVVRKPSGIFEHIDTQPHTLQVRCSRCGTNHPYIVAGVEQDTVQILCKQCAPDRKGHLNIAALEAVWVG